MTSTRHALRLTTLALGVAALVAACGGSNSDSAVIRQNVSASAGGSYAADAQGVSVVVPAGALSGDAQLTVTRVADASLPAGGAFAAGDFKSDAYEVTLVGTNGAAVTLSQPIKLVLHASALPTHPTLGEVASVEAGAWQRVGASFFRAGSQSAVALVNAPRGTYRVAFRTLQRTSGDAVARGLIVMND